MAGTGEPAHPDVIARRDERGGVLSWHHPVSDSLAPKPRLVRHPARSGPHPDVMTISIRDAEYGWPPASWRHRSGSTVRQATAEADLGRERGPVFAQRDQPRPGAHRPGPGCLGVAGPVMAVSGLQGGGHQGLDRAAGQLAGRVAEHLLQPQVGQRERAAAVGQRHPVLQRVDQLPRHCRGGARHRPLRLVAATGITVAGALAAVAACRDG